VCEKSKSEYEEEEEEEEEEEAIPSQALQALRVRGD
jgi:hypothetical protein